MIQKTSLTVVAMWGASALAAPALAAPSVRIEDAAAQVVVIPEARSDVRVDVRRGGELRVPMPTLHKDGDALVVDGALRGRIAGCVGSGVHMGLLGGGGPGRAQRVNIRGVGLVPVDQLPVITAHVPMQAAVAAGEAAYGKVGRSEGLKLALSGCGDWAVEDVSGPMVVAMHGSGDVRAGRAGSLRAALSGSGDLTMGDVAGAAVLAVQGSADTQVERVAGPLTVDLAGSGDLKAREVDGPITSHQGGSGDITIAGGRAPRVQVQTSGSGDFAFHGEAGAVAASSSGSGDITIDRATGPVSKSRAGSGDVRIGG